MGGDGHTVPAGASEVRLCKAEMLTERLGGQEAGAATGGNGRRHQGLRSQTQPAASALQAAELSSESSNKGDTGSTLMLSTTYIPVSENG